MSGWVVLSEGGLSEGVSIGCVVRGGWWSIGYRCVVFQCIIIVYTRKSQ